MNPLHLWPSPIYKAHYDGDLTQLKELLMSMHKIQTDHILLKNGGKSTYDKFENLLEWNDFKELNDWIIVKSKIVWSEWGLSGSWQLRTHRSWFSTHPPGAWCEEHSHDLSHMVLVVYVSHPKNSGYLLVKNPLHHHWSSWPKSKESDNEWVPVPVVSGDVLFFPGFLEHKTQINQSEENRLIISSNMILDFYGNPDD